MRKVWMRAAIPLAVLLLAGTGLAGAEDESLILPQGPLTVEESVRIALLQNHFLRESEAGIGVSEGARMSALAGVLPGVQGSATYSKTTTTRTDKDVDLATLLDGTVLRRGDIERDTDLSSTGFGVGVGMNLSLPLWYRYRSAHHDVMAARFGREATAQQIAYDVRQQFYLVLRAISLEQVQEEDLKLARDEERRTTSMYELGSRAKADVLKSNVRVSDAELALIQQKNAVNIEKARLATLLGIPPSHKFEISGNMNPQPVLVDSMTAAEQSLDRPDLQQAREIVNAAGSMSSAAKTSWLPALFANFDYNFNDGSGAFDVLNNQLVADSPNPGDTTLVRFPTTVTSQSQDDGWTFRVGATITLDAFLNMGEAKRASSFKRVREQQLEGLELEVQRELEEAILNYQASIEAIAAAQNQVISAEEDLRLSRERYEQGLGTVLELIEAQVALTRARNNLVNSETGLKISEAALDKARAAPLPDVG